MNDQDWSLLQAIYDEKNLTKAAERLYISQPALTYRIQQIEQEFGVKVILRSNKKISFTPEGEYLVAYAKKMLLEQRKAKDFVTGMSHEVQGSLRIGCSSNFALYKLPPLLKQFLSQFSKVEINVKSGWSSEIVRLLQYEDVQVGLVTGDYKWTDEMVLINEEPVCIISKQKIDLASLPDLPRINYFPGRGHPNPKDPLIANSIDDWWQQQYSRPPLITMHIDKVEACKEMVQNGLGYSIIPRATLTDKDDFYTIDLHYKNGEALMRRTWMLYRASSLELSAVNRFVHYVKAYYANQKTE
ncbi:LysR family transcriptional regulator [Brevibacillus borstelensis]|uniref:LysR family transcriptional regulator n=1 Tax=Brevibacillus borstelensis TaxID=45462 RepID=UPI0030C0B0D2